MAHSNDHGVTISFLLITALILIIGFVCATFYVNNTMPSSRDYAALSSDQQPVSLVDIFNEGRKVRLTPTPAGGSETEGTEAETATVAKTPVDMEAVIAAINKGGCIACHTIPDIPGAIGQVGPDLSNIGLDGASRREGYTAEEYIRESLQQPAIFTAPKCPTGPCPPGAMPTLQLDDAEIEAIVAYLVTLGVDK